MWSNGSLKVEEKDFSFLSQGLSSQVLGSALQGDSCVLELVRVVVQEANGNGQSEDAIK